MAPNTEPGMQPQRNGDTEPTSHRQQVNSWSKLFWQNCNSVLRRVLQNSNPMLCRCEAAQNRFNALFHMSRISLAVGSTSRHEIFCCMWDLNFAESELGLLVALQQTTSTAHFKMNMDEVSEECKIIDICMGLDPLPNFKLHVGNACNILKAHEQASSLCWWVIQSAVKPSPAV